MDDYARLARASRAVLVAPAGYGKTYSIVRAVSLSEAGLPHLVLTHTNAGVDVLRRGFRDQHVSGHLYRVYTIAGWACKYAVSYPETSAIGDPTQDWPGTYRAVTNLLSLASMKRVVSNSYAGVYVDEYQDCTVEQHRLILQLAEIIPCKVLGDPLQGIFDLDEGDRLVNWEVDVFPAYERLPDLSRPWRWKKTNPTLGEWLQEARDLLERAQPVDLQGAPVRWIETTDESAFETRLRECFRALAYSESVVGIQQVERQRHNLARRLQGHYSCIERADYRDLVKYARMLDDVEGTERALKVLEFACICISGLRDTVGPVVSALRKGTIPRKTSPALAPVIEVCSGSAYKAVGNALEALSKLSTSVYRRDLLSQMRRAIRECESTPGLTLSEAVDQVCNRMKYLGRPLFRRVLGSTFLVKGLEFDNCLILDTASLTVNDLYVAITRGSHSLAVLSASPILVPSVRRHGPRRRPEPASRQGSLFELLAK